MSATSVIAVPKKLSDHRESYSSHFIAGMAGGIAEWAIGHPLDTVRVRIMAASMGGPPAPGAIAQVVTSLKSIRGIASLYRGSISDLLAAAVGSSLLFGVNNFFHSLLGVDRNQEGLSPGLVASAVGTGMVDAIAYKPLEIIKLRMQVSKQSFTM